MKTESWFSQPTLRSLGTITRYELERITFFYYRYINRYYKTYFSAIATLDKATKPRIITDHYKVYIENTS
jgi:hypothetical protein